MRAIAILLALVVPIAARAGITVGVDHLSVVHKSSNGVTIAFPDVCKTPAPGGPVPIPYPGIGQSSDTAKSTKRTKSMAIDKPTVGIRQPPATSVDVYSLDVKTGGKVLIQQTAGERSTTTATYVDANGKKMPLRDNALIKLANGDLCAICAAKDGRVTAVFRLLPKNPGK